VLVTLHAGKDTQSTQRNRFFFYIDSINYCYENKEIEGERQSYTYHLSVTNLTLICERFETFARTVNKYLAFNGNWSDMKCNFNLRCEDKAEQHNPHISLCRSRQVTDGDQIPTGKHTKW